MIFLQADLSFEADAETLSLFTNLDFDMDDDTCEKIGSGETLTTSSDKETEGQTDNSEERTTDEEEDDEEENAETMVHSVEQNSGKDYAHSRLELRTTVGDLIPNMFRFQMVQSCLVGE